MTSLLPFILFALIGYGLATILALFVIRYFHIRLRFNPYIYITFAVIGAFLLTIMLGLVSKHIISPISFWSLFFFLLIVSIPIHILARRFGNK